MTMTAPKHSTCFIVYVICTPWILLYGQIEVPSKKPQIFYMHITSDVKYRFATTLIVSKVLNVNEKAEVVQFDVTLPNEAFIANFTMETDGNMYIGEVKEKEQARQEFERAQSRGQSAGHIAASPRETNKFNININVEAKSIVTFRLTYQELLKRFSGSYHHIIFVDPGQPVADFKIEVAIQESRDITHLQIAPVSDVGLLDDINTDSLVTVDRTSYKSMVISYSPTIDQQEKISSRGVSGQFKVLYDVERSKDAGDVLVVDGYFVHFFAPNNIQPLPKDILIVLDKSGSMNGGKLKQQADAILRILDDVMEIDRFNIMFFDSNLTWFQPNVMLPGSKINIAQAKEFISQIGANGGTNINSALTEGLRLVMRLYNELRAPLVMFLTDGEPTVGVTNILDILSNVKDVNEMQIPIFSLAFGTGSDYEFLKRISAQNNGFARKIYEDSDAALQIIGLYSEISTALLRNVTFSYLDNEIENNTVTQTEFPTYFSGSELIVAGKVKDTALTELQLAVYGHDRQGQVELENPSSIVNLTTKGDFRKITEKMWAFITIKQLINDLDKNITDETRTTMKAKILELSLKYQFVTPLTSMVVTKPLVEHESTLNVNSNNGNSNMGTHPKIMSKGALPATPTVVYQTSIAGAPPQTTTYLPRHRTTRITTATLAPLKLCKKYRGMSSPDVYIYIHGLDGPLCMKLPFQPYPFQQDDYLFLTDQAGNSLTANIRKCTFGKPDENIMLIESFNFVNKLRLNKDGARFQNGSFLDWKSMGNRYKFDFKSFQTTVTIAPSNGQIGSLEVHAFIPHKLKKIGTPGGLLGDFIGMIVNNVKIIKKRKSMSAKVQLPHSKTKLTIKNAKMLTKISPITLKCWQVKDPENSFKINLTSFKY